MAEKGGRLCIYFISLILLAFVISTVALSVLLGVYVHKWKTQRNTNNGDITSGIDISIKTTWNSILVDHPPINITLRWSDCNTAIRVTFEAPYFNDPPAPPNRTSGVVPGLYNYEVIELFFANSLQRYLEVEVGPYNQWLIILLDGERKDFNTGEMIQLSVWNQRIGNTWRGGLDIPLAYLPPNVTTMNAYGIHGSDPNRIYEAYGPTPNGKFQNPDFHRLSYFVPVDMSKILPKKYMTKQSPYIDQRYGDMWQGHY